MAKRSTIRPKKIFLSYRRAEPDQAVVTDVQAKLAKAGHDVFRDVDIPVGQRWAEAIQQQLREADVFIIFLSEQSMDRDMVREEVKQAYQRSRQEGRPAILPVRLNYEGALPYDMNAWLTPFQYALWRGPEDTSKIADQLIAAVSEQSALPLQGADATPEERRAFQAATEESGRPLPKAEPAVLDVLGMRAGSPFYMDRDVDQQFLDSLAYGHGVAALRAPRQMGKTSMLAQTRKRLDDLKLKSVFLDLRMLESETFADVREAMIGLAMLIADQANLDLDPESFFTGRGFPTSKLQRFLAAAFGTQPQRTVLLFDDVDCLFGKPYRDGLFGGLRTIIDQKPNDPGIANIGFGFAHAQDPTSWIGNKNESPFNVAQPYSLREFSDAEMQRLNALHGGLLKTHQLEELKLLLGGHPFLTRTAFYRLAHDKVAFDELSRLAHTDEGFFADHLRTRLMLVLELKLAAPFKRILDAGKCDDIRQFQALQALGVVKGESHKAARARYGIYESYFKVRLDG